MTDMNPKILAVIPARGGSKTIPDKNIRLLLGRPLIEYTFDAARSSRFIHRIIVSTDSPHIADISRKNGIEVPFLRPPELALDTSPTLPAVVHAVQFLETQDGYKPQYIVLLQPTSPLRTARHIDEAIELLTASGADSVVSAIRVPHNCNPYSIMQIQNNSLVPFMKDGLNYTRRQNKPDFYARNGAAVYAFTYETLMKNNSLYGDNCKLYLMNKCDSVDIDDLDDFELAEFYLKKRLPPG